MRLPRLVVPSVTKTFGTLLPRPVSGARFFGLLVKRSYRPDGVAVPLRGERRGEPTAPFRVGIKSARVLTQKRITGSLISLGASSARVRA